MQKSHLPVLASKLPRLIWGGNGPRTKIWVDLSPWYSVYTKTMFIWKGSYGYGESKNVFLFSVQKPHLPVRSCKLPPSHVQQYMADNRNLRKPGSSFTHGTVFAPKHCLYQKEATSMERPKMYSSSRCKNHNYQCGPANYPIWCESVMAQEWKFGSTFRHGTVVAPKQCWYQKEATGMESPKMYSYSRSKKRTYLCRPANYPVWCEAA